MTQTWYKQSFSKTSSKLQAINRQWDNDDLLLPPSERFPPKKVQVGFDWGENSITDWEHKNRLINYPQTSPVQSNRDGILVLPSTL